MKLLCYILLTVSLFSCKAKYITQVDMPSGFETFDVKSYRANKDSYFDKSLNVKFSQSKHYNKVTLCPNDTYYDLSKRFYNNGNIKEKGLFFGDIRIGIWEYYTDDGTLEKTVDEDKKFNPKFNYNHILDYLHKRGSINKYRKKANLEIDATLNENNGVIRIWVKSPTNKKGPSGGIVKLEREYKFDKDGTVLLKQENNKIIPVNH